MYPLCLPLCCFFRYGKNYYFSKRCFPCMLPASGWPHFFYYLLLRPLSFLGCLHFFSQQNSLKVTCKKKPVEKKVSCKKSLRTSFNLQEIWDWFVANFGCDLLRWNWDLANFGCASLRWNWSLANFCCALNLEKDLVNFCNFGCAYLHWDWFVANFGCVSLRWNWSLANFSCALNLEKLWKKTLVKHLDWFVTNLGCAYSLEI